jgi:Membrane proteins related to metalloendopeptidases
MHKIDERFRRQKAEKLAERRRRRLRRRLRLALSGLALIGLASGGWFWFETRPPELEGSEEAPVQVADVAVPVYVPVIIDLPGDPIRIELGDGGASTGITTVPAPPQLAGLGIRGRLHLMSGNIVESGQRLVLSIPSTPQDFAFFQSQRGAVTGAGAGAQEAPIFDDEAEAEAPDETFQPAAETEAPEPADEVTDAEGETGGWGDLAGQETGGGGPEDFARTTIENTTTTLTLVRDVDRFKVTDDVFVRVTSEVETGRFLTENDINLLDARRAAEAFKAEFGIEAFREGSIVAMRQLRAGGRTGDRKLVQIATYLPDAFLGALAVSGAGAFVQSVDPWVNRNLFEHVEQAPAAAATRYRLLDGIFSAGIRNGVPSSVVGEAIMYLSRKYDLSEFAGPQDEVTLLYGEDAREGGESAGRVLYASIRQGDKTMRCFVFRPADANDFNCLDEHDQSNTIEVTNGMVTPVAGGVLTSGFGPRRHPILNKVLTHSGVDWAAPVGTQVRAAYDGVVAFAGEGGGYGNVIKLSHGKGRETRYAHLSGFAKTLAPGAKVRAGDVIGFVGTTGRSTGPHLHFELHVGGAAINPLQTGGLAADGGDDAVGKLVDRIVRVESGGNATAKNPLSTATGLGQFIESTWLRMMRTYRADLVNSMSREDLLALRFDPTLSREMVANLARENKSYLQAGGISPTAGQLYLAHFLGPEGARTVLLNPDDTDLEALLGSSVIRANPFLTGKNVAYIKDWAERKMRGGGSHIASAPTTTTTTVKQASPEFTLFRKTIIEVAGGA